MEPKDSKDQSSNGDQSSLAPDMKPPIIAHTKPKPPPDTTDLDLGPMLEFQDPDRGWLKRLKRWRKRKQKGERS
jgi:hypothetical protein